MKTFNYYSMAKQINQHRITKNIIDDCFNNLDIRLYEEFNSFTRKDSL